MQTVSKNKKAIFNYEILDTIECGIVLSGCEIKSVRLGNINMQDSYAQFKANELFVYNIHIKNYDNGSFSNMEPVRPRKLLLHKNELLKLKIKQKTDHIVLIPTKVYFNHKVLKLELAIAKPKKLYDKRQTIKEKEAKKNINRNLKNSNNRY